MNHVWFCILYVEALIVEWNDAKIQDEIKTDILIQEDQKSRKKTEC